LLSTDYRNLETTQGKIKTGTRT